MMGAQPPSGLSLLVRPSREEASLWRRLRFEGETACRLILFERYAGLARSVAIGQFRRRHSLRIERLDYEQLAYEGLLQAIDRYDPLRGVPFSAFARPRINGNVATGVARMTEIDAQLSHRRRIEQERLRSLAARDDGLAMDDPVKALSELAVGLALGVMLGARDRAMEQADPAPSAYESLEWRELQATFAREIERLPVREAQIIRQHYEKGLSFAHVAQLLGVSAGRVSQLHRAALERLRKRIGAFD